jgi:hypothetical protein
MSTTETPQEYRDITAFVNAQPPLPKPVSDYESIKTFPFHFTCKYSSLTTIAEQALIHYSVNTNNLISLQRHNSWW